jgi:predicted CXXCH cytochrome family protein
MGKRQRTIDRTVPPLGRGIFSAIAIAVVASCQQKVPAPVGQSRSAATASAATHAVHAGFVCEACHPCGAEYSFAGALPSGTPIAGTITWGTPTTCAVSCHNPFTTTFRSVAWNDGPMTCTSCHAQTVVVGAFSSHAPTALPAECLTCHDNSTHLSGNVRLTVGDGKPGNSGCKSCHSGQGKRVADATPPVAIGLDADGFDPHGAGGASPEQPCLDCHDAHSSTSAFLLRRDGMAPQAFIARAGVGAEALCSTCHATRHASCVTSCHQFHDGEPNRQVHFADPVPSGAPCFACHGHEGIVRGDERVNGWAPITQYFGFSQPGQCKHCHPRGEPNLPPLDRDAPQLSRIVVTNDGVASASVTWTSQDKSTSYIELVDQLSGALRTVGESRFRLDHDVALSGLDAARTYAVRIWTADRMRNVTVADLGVLALGAPSTPVPAILPDRYFCSSSPEVTFQWSASTDPGGGPILYELQVDQSPAFTAGRVLASASGATSLTARLAASVTGTSQYWRIRAREAPAGLASPWSATHRMILYRYNWLWCF